MRKHLFVFVALFLHCCVMLAQDKTLTETFRQQTLTGKTDTAKANSYYELSKCFWYDMPDSAIYFAEQSLVLAQKNNYQRGIAFANYSIGVSYVWKEDFYKAMQFTEKGLNIGKQTSDSAVIAYCYLNMGVVYASLTKYPEGLKYFYEALRISDQLQLSEVQGWAYMNLSSVLYNANNKAESIKYDSLLFKRALASGNKEDLGLVYMSFGINQSDNTNYTEALKNFEKAIGLFSLNNSVNNIGLCYRYTGVALRKQGKYNQSLEYFLKELNLPKITPSDFRFADVYSEIGLAYQQMGNYTEAYSYYKKALPYGIKQNNFINITGVFKCMAYVDSATGNYKQALADYKMYFIYNDSLKNTERTQKITEQKMQYDFDKKEAVGKAQQEKKDAIALEESKQQRAISNVSFAGIAALLLFGAFTYNRYLQRKKLSNQLSQSLIELRQTQSQLIQLEKEKEAEAIRLRISRDIHDDIGSNLTKIAMMGNLAAAQSQNKMPEIKEQLEKISDYARNVNNSMSEIVWAINPKQDTLENLLGYMRVHTQEFLKDSGINYKINFPESIPNIQLNPDLKRGLFLVVKESLNNTVKHAHAKNVTLSFSLKNENPPLYKRSGGAFELQITDDGSGFILSEINSNKSGNGLHNMKNRVKQCDCNLKIQTSPGKGCKVNIDGML